MNVVLMAGGNPAHPFSEEYMVKSLALVKGKPMVRWVVEALRGSEKIDEICITGPKAELEQALTGIDRITVLEGKAQMADNMFMGIQHFAEAEQVLICTADVPMIKSEMIDWLVTECEKRSWDFIYPIIPKEINQARFPDMPRTYVKVKDGAYTGGNITCVRPKAGDGNEGLIHKMMELRKNPLKMAGLLGFKVLFGLVTGKLEIAAAEKRFMKVTGADCRVMVCPYPEIGSDVDRPEDIPLVEKEL